jgi:hypothetical protein
MADSMNDPDYKEYQEYLEYLNHIKGSPQAGAKPSNQPLDPYTQNLVNVGDKLAPTGGAIGRGFVHGATMGMYKPPKTMNLPDEPLAEKAAGLAGMIVGGKGIEMAGAPLVAGAGKVMDLLGSIPSKGSVIKQGLAQLFKKAAPEAASVAEKAPEMLPSGARNAWIKPDPTKVELGPKPEFIPKQGNPEIESLLQPPKPSAPELPVELEATPPFRPRPTNPEVEAMIQPPKPPIPEAPVQLEPIPGFKPKPDVTIPEPIDPVMRGTQQYHSLGDAVPNKLTPAEVAVPEPMKVPTEFATKLAEPKIPLKAKASLSDAMQSSPKEMSGFRGDPGKLSLEELMTPEAQSKVPGLVDMLLKARIK